MLAFISFIIVISVLVFVHELGHFLVARACDVYVKEFSIGMGPTLFKIKGKETTYSIKALPIGGSVQMLGEDGVDKEIDDEEEVDQDVVDKEINRTYTSENPRSFINKPAWQRLLIIVAGPVMNFLFALIILVVVYMGAGFLNTQIQEVVPRSAAAEAGIVVGDKIIKIDDKDIHSFNHITAAVLEAKGNEMNVSVERRGEMYSYTLKPRFNKSEKRYLIGIRTEREHSFLGALNQSAFTTWHVSKNIVEFIPKIPQIFTGQIARDNVAGPIGIAKISGQAAREGFWYFLRFMAFISINLGIMNMLPIPALDGGRFLLILIELIFRRKLNPAIEEKIQLIGFALLMVLMIFVIINDITQL